MKPSWFRVFQRRPWLVLFCYLCCAWDSPSGRGDCSRRFSGRNRCYFFAIVAALEKVIFFDIGGMPLVVLWLLIDAVFFLSSHGRTGLRRFLLGSVAERVVRFSHCPVLVIR